jgi:hypothetical protein
MPAAHHDSATQVKRDSLNIAQVIWFGLGFGAYITSFILPAVSNADQVPMPEIFIACMASVP